MPLSGEGGGGGGGGNSACMGRNSAVKFKDWYTDNRITGLRYTCRKAFFPTGVFA